MSADNAGFDALGGRLRAMGEAVRDALRRNVAEQGEQVAQSVRDDKLSGQVVGVRSGALRDSVAARQGGDGEGLTVEVFSAGVSYAAILEYGGTLPPHEVAALNGGVLAFQVDGLRRFSRVVHFPGAVIAGRNYLHGTLDERSGDIAQGLAEAARREVAW